MSILIDIPEQSKSDTIWNFTIKNLPVNKEVIISAEMEDTFGALWRSDAMGLIWSMTSENTHGILARRFDLSPATLKIRVFFDGANQAEKNVTRYIISDLIKQEEIREDGLVGKLYTPGDHSNPKGAIIVLSGSEGGFRAEQAALLAQEGYVSLALAYFNAPEMIGLPTKIKQIPLEYFQRAIAFLQNHPQVSKHHIAVMGTSRGGELALLLGSTFSEISAVIAYVPNFAIQAAFGPSDHLNDEVAASWTYKNQPLPCFPLHVKNVKWFDKSPVVLKHGFLNTDDIASLQSDNINPDAIIPVEKINGPVLLLSGGDDQMWPSQNMSELIMNRLQRYHHRYLEKSMHLNYPKAGHLIMVPWWPSTGYHAIHPVDQVDYAFGGNAQADAYAGYESWQSIKEFLRTNLNPV